MFDIYLRVSQLGERDDAEATEVYEAQCRDWAERNDTEIDEVVIDTDVSGSVAVADRKLERVVRKVEQGESDGIVTPWLDRFGRDQIEGSLAYRRIKKAEGRLVCVKDGTDSDRDGDELVFQVRMAIAEDFLRRNRANRLAAIDRKAELGAYVARCPYGYRKDDVGRLVVIPEEAELVAQVFDRRAAGQDRGMIQRFLRDEGAISPQSGKPFTKSGVRSILGNRAYLGEATYQTDKKGQVRVVKNAHAPIVSESVFNAANAIEGTFFPRTRILVDQVRHRGLVYCATCNTRMKVGGRNGGKNEQGHIAQYVCTTPGCDKHAVIRADKLDAYVEGLLMQAAASKEPHIARVIEGDTRYTDALAAVEEAQRLHDELRDDIDVQRTIGTKDWAVALKVRKEALQVAKRELSKARPHNVKRADDPDRAMTFAEFIEEYERGANSRFLDRIVIHPIGRGYKRPPSERADIYLAGSDEPYVPIYGKVSKKDQAIIDAHLAATAA